VRVPMPRELLHELVPAAVSIGLLINPANPNVNRQNPVSCRDGHRKQC
jgi:hypothetical protein